MTPLTVEERAALEFEQGWRGGRHQKTRALAAAGWTPSHFFLVLGTAIIKPCAEVEYPELVRRLRRLRAIRASERHGARTDLKTT